jgi:hypothetical protein
MSNHRSKSQTDNQAFSRRNVLLAGITLAAAFALASSAATEVAQAQQRPTTAPSSRPPNILVIWGDDIG